MAGDVSVGLQAPFLLTATRRETGERQERDRKEEREGELFDVSCVCKIHASVQVDAAYNFTCSITNACMWAACIQQS